MDYTVVRLTLSVCETYVQDVLASELGAIGYESFEQTDEGLDAYVQSSLFDEQLLCEVLRGFYLDDAVEYAYEHLERKNWNEAWETYYFEPIVVAGRCVIHSSFHQDIPDVDYDIVINPKMAFGTGHHETTRLMLEMILSLDVVGKRVLDMGCGTSVLAILAAKCGATSLLGVDIDDWCVENSLENISLNGVEGIEVLQGDASLLAGRCFDVILANINRNILLDDMSSYVSCLPVGGQLLLSGFYQEDVALLVKEATQLGLVLLKETSLHNWACLLLERR